MLGAALLVLAAAPALAADVDVGPRSLLLLVEGGEMESTSHAGKAPAVPGS